MERRRFLSEGSYLEGVEYDALMSEIQRKFEGLNRIEERCLSNHIRCLRFWQRSRQVNRDEKSGHPAYDRITRFIPVQ